MGNTPPACAGIPALSCPAPELGVETRATKRRRLHEERQVMTAPLTHMETRRSARRRVAALACPICFEAHPCARPVVCEHLFHLPCLLEWCAHENSCPVCRAFFNHIVTGTGPPVHVDDAVQCDDENDSNSDSNSDSDDNLHTNR